MIVYYSFQTLLIGGLMALYGVQAFAERKPECLDLTGRVNVTSLVTSNFRIIFFIHLCEFLNSAFFAPFFQVLLPLHTSKLFNSAEHSITASMRHFVLIIEWMLRGFVVLAIAFQFLLLH